MHSLRFTIYCTWGIWLLGLVLLEVGLVRTRAQIQPRVDLTSVEFRNRFLGTYGTLGEFEPKITQEESKLLTSILEDITNHPNQAYSKLSSSVTSHSSAALDYVLGNLKFQLSDEQAAVGHYQSALDKFPDFRRAQQNLGYALVQQDQFKEGRKHLLRAVELGAMSGELMGVIAFTHWQDSQYAATEAAYRQALLFDARRSDWKLGLALSVTQQGRDSEAIAIYDELITLDSQNTDYWLAQADIFLKQNNEEAALSNYEMARRLGASNPSMLVNLASLYLNQGLTKRAVDIFTSITPKLDNPLWNRTLNALEIIMSQDQWESAEVLWVRLDQVKPAEFPQNLHHHWNRLSAWRALKKESFERATILLKDLVKINPLDGRSMLLLADALEKQGKKRESIQILERASRLDDYRGQALRRLVNDALSKENFEKAYQNLSLLQDEGFDLEIAETLRQLERILSTKQPKN